MGKGEEIAAGQNAFPEVERRRFPRRQVFRDTLLYNQNSFAEILDISCGGIACRGHVMPAQSEADSELELLNCDLGLNVQGLRCRRVRWDSNGATTGRQKVEESVWFYEFAELSNGKRAELDRFIETCTNGSRPEVIFS